MTLLFLHTSYAQTMGKKVALTVALYATAIMACGTKEIVFISPFLLMLVDWFYVAHGTWDSFKKRLWLHASLFGLVTGISLYFLKPSFFTSIFGFNMAVKNNIGNIITEQPGQKITQGLFFISQFKVILHYIVMFLWPFNISVEYDWVLCKHLLAPDCILPLLVLLAIGLCIFRVLYTKRSHVLCFGALWFFMCIAPRSSIIPSPELLVDYKTYTASIGWFLIIAAAIIKLIEALGKRFLGSYNWFKSRHARACCSFLLVVPLGMMTLQRNTVWRSGTEFWMNIIQNAPGKARAYNNYGVELSQIYKRYEEAVPFFKKAIEMDNNYPDPCNNLAVCYSHLEKIDEAIAALKEGLRINPYYPEGYNNIASFYLRKKEYDNVEKCLKTALKLRPHYGKAYFNWGRMHSERGNHKEALECFKKACTIADLDNEFGFKVYAQAAFGQGEFEQAIWAYSKALECAPGDLEVCFNLANTYYLAKQYDQAVTTYKQLVAQRPDDIRFWYNLAEAHFMKEDIQASFDCLCRIAPHWEQLPQICIRMAGCYDKMGQPEKAREQLERLMNNEKVHVGMQSKARLLMAQLDGKMQHSHVSA